MAKEKKYNPFFEAGYTPKNPKTGEPHLATINPAALPGTMARKNNSYFLWKLKWAGILSTVALITANIYSETARDITADVSKKAGSATLSMASTAAASAWANTKEIIAESLADKPRIGDKPSEKLETITLAPEPEAPEPTLPSLVPKNTQPETIIAVTDPQISKTIVSPREHQAACAITRSFLELAQHSVQTTSEMPPEVETCYSQLDLTDRFCGVSAAMLFGIPDEQALVDEVKGTVIEFSQYCLNSQLH